jgi:hypothetical protein
MAAMAVSVSSELTDEDVRQLLAVFEPNFTLLSEGQKLSPGWETWLLLAKDVAAVATDGQIIREVAKGISAFRERLARDGRQPAVQLSARGEMLNLSEAQKRRC